MSTKNENNQYKGNMIDRSKFIICTGGAITSLTLLGVDAFADLPKLMKKSKYKIINFSYPDISHKLYNYIYIRFIISENLRKINL